jgi:hypothetical protein
LALEINSQGVVDVVNSLSLPKLKHLHIGTSSSFFFSTQFAQNPEAFPLLESFGMKGSSTAFHKFLVVRRAFPNLKRLNFEASHPLCGGKPWYFKGPLKRATTEESVDLHVDILEQYPETSVLSLDYQHISSFRRIWSAGGGFPHLT